MVMYVTDPCTAVPLWQFICMFPHVSEIPQITCEDRILVTKFLLVGTVVGLCNIITCGDLAALEKDYDEVGIETAQLRARERKKATAMSYESLVVEQMLA